MAQETYLIVADYLPTKDKFSGHQNEDELAAKMEAANKKREEAGYKSPSQASGTIL